MRVGRITLQKFFGEKTLGRNRNTRNGGNMKIQNIGIYRNLLIQLDKVVKHTRQGSYKTRERYHSAWKRFCAFLADNYRLEKIANVAPKHIVAYTKYMQEKGLSASTIKTDLTAIRFYHDQMAYTKHTLPDNNKLNLKKRKFGGVDRTWSHCEFNKMIALCWQTGNENYACIAVLGYYTALRIEECFKLDTAQAEKAIKTGILTVKGKGGLVRDVPVQETIIIELKKMLAITPQGHKLFVAPNDKTHLAIKRLQNFINYHRNKFADVGHGVPLTFHGLRHTAAANWYKSLKDKGFSDYAARKQVAAWLGHGRDDVTRIYLAGIKDGDDDV